MKYKLLKHLYLLDFFAFHISHFREDHAKCIHFPQKVYFKNFEFKIQTVNMFMVVLKFSRFNFFTF